MGQWACVLGFQYWRKEPIKKPYRNLKSLKASITKTAAEIPFQTPPHRPIGKIIKIGMPIYVYIGNFNT